jgi:hypothetical protein
MPGSLPARQVLLQSKIIIHFPKEAIGKGGGEKKKLKKIMKFLLRVTLKLATAICGGAAWVWRWSRRTGEAASGSNQPSASVRLNFC